MPKKAKYIKKDFESSSENWDTSANIYMSMLLSDAWKALTTKQKLLYTYCKAQYYAEKKKPDGAMSFTMNQSKWCNLYELYTIANHKAFYTDMGALIDKGFIICSECGAVTRTKNIYKYSDMWQRYGTKFFHVDPNQMTMSMRRRNKKKEDKDIDINESIKDKGEARE